MAKKKVPAPTGAVAIARPIEPSGDMRRLIRETGKHTANTLSIVQDMIVFDAASYAALNGLLAHHGNDLDPKIAASAALEYAKELVEQRRIMKSKKG